MAATKKKIGIVGGAIATTQPDNAPYRTIEVRAGGDFQAAIDAANPGETIALEAGASFQGEYYLRRKADDARPITITSSRLAELPAAGGRVTPEHAALMPKILARGKGAGALYTEPGAHHYTLTGLEILQSDPSVFVYDLVVLGRGDNEQATLESVPHHLKIDRCYIHAHADGELKRGIALNSADTEIVNSYISGFKAKGQDTQAIAGWNGPGRYLIENNYLEASGYAFITGGSTGGLTAAGQVIEDITFRRNTVSRPLAWRGVWSVKNLFELKNARRVVVDGNLFENNWADAQSGQAILLTPRPNDSGPGAVVEDVEFTNNIIRNVAGAFSIMGKDYLYAQDSQSVRLRRVRIANNLITGIAGDGSLGGYGAFLLIVDGTDQLTIENNTAIGGRSTVIGGSSPHTNFKFLNNIASHGQSGIAGDGTGSGIQTLERWYPGAVVTGNVLIGAGPPPHGPYYDPPKWYPAGQFFPPTNADAGFIDEAKSDFRLKQTSPYKSAGYDAAKLTAAQAGEVIALPPPPPPPLIQVAWPSGEARQDAVAAAQARRGYYFKRHLRGATAEFEKVR